MNEGEKESLCTTCIHLPICSLKETFLEAQKAVNNATIYETQRNEDGGTSIKETYVANLRDWIEPPRLKCKHYIQKGEPIVR